MALHAGDAAAGDDHRRAHGHRIGAKAQALYRVDPVADSAHEHELHLAQAVDLTERLDRLGDGGERGHAHVLHHLGAARAGGALHPVELDEVEAVLVGDLDVVPDPARTELDAHRDAVACGLAKLLHLDDQIVGAEDVGMARGRAQVDALGNPPDGGKLLGHLLRHELAAETRFRALADVDLEPVRPVHVRGCSSRADPLSTGTRAAPAAPRWASLMPPSPVFSAIPAMLEAIPTACLVERDSGAVAHWRDHHRH